jgi:hypothetical protein
MAVAISLREKDLETAKSHHRQVLVGVDRGGEERERERERERETERGGARGRQSGCVGE